MGGRARVRLRRLRGQTVRRVSRLGGCARDGDRVDRESLHRSEVVAVRRTPRSRGACDRAPRSAAADPGVRAHRIEILEADVTRVSGIVCTSRLRTAVDCLLWLPEEAGRAYDPRAPSATAQRRRGTPRTHQDAAATWADARVVGDARRVPSPALGGGGPHPSCAERGAIYGWESNVGLHDGDGLIGIVDLLFEDVKLVLEIDGRAYHSEDLAFQRTEAGRTGS